MCQKEGKVVAVKSLRTEQAAVQDLWLPQSHRESTNDKYTAREQNSRVLLRD